MAVGAEATSGDWKYPVTAKGDQKDDYHGTVVADPYRWLEDPDSPETRAWIEAENRLTFGYLDKLPARQKLRERLTELWNFERYSPPIMRGGKVFFTKNDGLQNQAVLYVADSLEGTPRVLLDPNGLSKDGTVALSGWTVSEDGKRLAYGTSAAGSDWQTWRVREVSTAQDLKDDVQWVKFSGASWTKDGRGFFYSRYDEPKKEEEFVGTNYFQKLYFHEVGKPQSEDQLVYQRDDQKEWGFSGDVTDDGKFLVVTVTLGTERKNGLFYLPLTGAGQKFEPSQMVELLKEFDAEYVLVGNEGPTFWLRTDQEAARGRLIAIDTRAPERAKWRELIGESTATLEEVHVVGERFVAAYLADAHSEVRLHTLEGKPAGTIALPSLGSAGAFTGRREDRETFFGFTSFATPGEVLRFDFEQNKVSAWRRPKLAFDPDDYVTRQVFFESKDGTRVPMFLTHRRDVTPGPETPTLLYAYGGFNISLTPRFSVANLVWMEMGGVFAQPSLRGGGEYGREWHEAGQKARKQNVFDDFIGAAEWLIRERMTSPAKLAISGRSNGGLLVGAAMAQRPELFGVALPGVGVMDMLRFHKFTIGWAWVPEYGSADDAEEFATLVKYSPLHNLKAGTAYPATLVTTADHDDRVVPAHSFKFAAALQAAQGGPKPCLIRIETQAGHGAGKPTAKLIEEAADTLAFLMDNLGMAWGK
jgi:prolyl oligopeptidase